MSLKLPPALNLKTRPGQPKTTKTAKSVKPKGPPRSVDVQTIPKLPNRKPSKPKKGLVAAPRQAPVNKGGRAGKLSGRKTQATALRGRRLGESQIPHGQARQGLSIHKDQSRWPDAIHGNLQKSSPWFQSILDPLHGADAKIPDAVGIDTGTLQCVEKYSFQVGTNAGAVAGVRVSTPYPFSGAGSNGDFIDGATSTVLSINWDAAVGVPFTFASNASLVSLTQGVRIVSFAMYVQGEMSLADNSGKLIGYCEPFGNSPFANALPASDYENHYKSVMVPVNNNKPIFMRWFPIKKNEYMYDAFYTPDSTVPRWEMGVIALGCDPGVVFDVTIVVNYEFVPLENTVNILSAHSSPVDATETELVEAWTQDMDVGGITTTAKVAAAPSDVMEKEDPTGFGMEFNVLTELLPYALEFLPLLL